jgi:hypothetical protein
MPREPAPADPGRDETPPRTPPGPDQAPPPGDPVEPGWEPVITRPDPMSAEEWEAWLDHLTEEDEPFDPEEYPDPEGAPPPGEDELTAAEIAGIAEAAEAEARGPRTGPGRGRRGRWPHRGAVRVGPAGGPHGRAEAGRGGGADPLAEKLHRDWRHISFARVLRTQALRTPGCCRARLPRHRPQPGVVGRACSAPLPDCQAAKASGRQRWVMARAGLQTVRKVSDASPFIWPESCCS